MMDIKDGARLPGYTVCQPVYAFSLLLCFVLFASNKPLLVSHTFIHTDK